MTLQTMLYFTFLLLTCLLTGCLAWYAWKHNHVPAARAYMRLTLSECFFALAEIFSVLSPSSTTALFWFQARYLAGAFMGVFWFVFALEYSVRREWLSKRLLAGLFVIPFITQVLLWSNSLHGLWMKQEAAFTQNGIFWIADVTTRIPGLGYLTHSFYTLLLTLAGIALMFLTAWNMRRELLGQALLLAGAGLTAFTFAMNSLFSFLPKTEFNPFTPGIGLSVLLIALSVFRFEFLKRAPAHESDSRITRLYAQEKYSLAVFILIFILFTSGLAAASTLTYQNYEKQFRAQAEAQLSAIAELKVNELVNWRAERMADAQAFHSNPAFTALAQRSLENPDDTLAKEQLQAWLDTIRTSYYYDRIFLLDIAGVERVSSPAAPEPVAAHLTQESAAIIRSDQIIFLDFHRDSPTGKIHLALLAPVYAEGDQNRPLGLLVLRIDPEIYLYPYIQQWPVPSQSAETLLIRREAGDALFLNPLRFKPDAALELRIPLENTEILAVKAALGQEGVVQGLDYRGEEVVGILRTVPDSPWLLVTRIDIAEVYAPLSERLWQTILFFGLLVLASGAGLMLVWRQGQVSNYRAQVEAAEILRSSEEKFRLAFDTSPDSVAITRARDGLFVSVNTGFEQISGYTREQVIGKTSAEINIWKNPEDRRKIVEGLRATGEVRNYEAPFLTRDGEIYGLMSAAIIQLNGEPHILNITRDITARKQAEDDLIAAEKLAQELLAASSQSRQALLSMVEDQKQTEDKIRQHATELEMLYQSGLTLNQLLSPKEIGQKIIELLEQKMDWHHTLIRTYNPQNETLELLALNQPDLKDEKERSAAEEHYKTLITSASQGVSGWAVLNSQIVRSGDVSHDPRYLETFPGLHSGLYVPIKSEEHVIGVISIESEVPNAFDEADERLVTTLANQAAVAIENARLYQIARQEIIERENIEVLLTDERNQLERRVRERTADLSLVNSELAQAIRVKDEFLASMSHELRTPLTGILGLSEALQMKTYGELNDRQKKIIKTIEESGRHLHDLINDILDLSKIEAGKLELQFVSCSLADICQAGLQLTKGMAQQKRQNVHYSPIAEPVIVRADARRLKQILVNLLGNAIKFTPPNGEVGLEVEVNKSEGKVSLTVWDKGIGIKPEDLPKLFKPFVQLDSSLARQYSGTGLGLTLVQRLTEMHNGSIEVKTVFGEGSRFTVSLPWHSQDTTPIPFTLGRDGPGELSSSVISLDGSISSLILLVDDNEVSLQMVADYLETKQYRVIKTRGGAELLERAAELHPDLMLVDIQMPGMDGLETIRRIRLHADPLVAAAPVIAVTALVMSGDRENCLSAGANDYMSKPLKLKELAAAIQKLLEEKQ